MLIPLLQPQERIIRLRDLEMSPLLAIIHCDLVSNDRQVLPTSIHASDLHYIILSIVFFLFFRLYIDLRLLHCCGFLFLFLGFLQYILFGLSPVFFLLQIFTF
jgi:hypothetical protein